MAFGAGRQHSSKLGYSAYLCAPHSRAQQKAARQGQAPGGTDPAVLFGSWAQSLHMQLNKERLPVRHQLPQLPLLAEEQGREEAGVFAQCTPLLNAPERGAKHSPWLTHWGGEGESSPPIPPPPGVQSSAALQESGCLKLRSRIPAFLCGFRAGLASPFDLQCCSANAACRADCYERASPQPLSRISLTWLPARASSLRLEGDRLGDVASGIWWDWLHPD